MDFAKLEMLEGKVNQVLTVINGLRDEKRELNSKIEALESQVQSFTEENGTLKEANDRLTADLGTVTAEKEQLVSSHAELEANRPGEAEAQKVDELMKKLESLDI